MLLVGGHTIGKVENIGDGWLSVSTMVGIRSQRTLVNNTDPIKHSFGHDMREVGQCLIGGAGFPS